MTNRVAVTGIGLICPLGHSIDVLLGQLYKGSSGIQVFPEWEKMGMSTILASPVLGFDEKTIPRKFRRSMSRVSTLSTFATKKAIESAKLDLDSVQDRRTGISYASTMGGTSAIDSFFTANSKEDSEFNDIESTTFLKIMPHTAAANLALAFSVPGRIIASNVACAASTQSIGLGYEAIKYGLQDRMICGGAEELHFSMATVFDVLGATSKKFNHNPEISSRPFSSDRDGLVVGEGAGTLILENWELAKKRGAEIFGEIKGFYTNNDAKHMTSPSIDGMKECMKGALDDAKIHPHDIGYLNAHATGTHKGDEAESFGIKEIFGSEIPISSLKGHLGHLMGASGVVEIAASMGMLHSNRLIPTKNLTEEGPELAKINYLKKYDSTLYNSNTNIIKNSFAFGGINTSIVIAKGNKND